MGTLINHDSLADEDTLSSRVLLSYRERSGRSGSIGCQGTHSPMVSLSSHGTLVGNGSLFRIGTLPQGDHTSIWEHSCFYGSLDFLGTLKRQGSLTVKGTLLDPGSLSIMGTHDLRDSLTIWGTLRLHVFTCFIWYTRQAGFTCLMRNTQAKGITGSCGNYRATGIISFQGYTLHN